MIGVEQVLLGLAILSFIIGCFPQAPALPWMSAGLALFAGAHLAG